jgi:hypothetical protein
MIRVSAIACAIGAAALVYFSSEPKLSALSDHLAETSAVLRSDDIVLSNVARVRAQHDLLQHRLSRILRRDVEATFIRDLDSDARRHAADVVSTTAQHDGVEGTTDDADTGLRHFDFTIELRGGYRSLLATIANLSSGNQMVEVRSISLRRSDRSLIARVPIVLFEADAQ